MARAGLSRATILRVALSTALALLAWAVARDFKLRVPLGLDERALTIPTDNPLTQEKIDLGKQLFFDRRWSNTRTVSCASCHQPQRGWSDDRRLSADHEGKPTRRHAPTIINRAFSTLEGWAGHRSSTEDSEIFSTSGTRGTGNAFASFGPA